MTGDQTSDATFRLSLTACPVPKFWVGQLGSTSPSTSTSTSRLGSLPSALSRQPQTSSTRLLSTFSAVPFSAVPYRISSQLSRPDTRTVTEQTHHIPNAWQIVTGPFYPSGSCSTKTTEQPVQPTQPAVPALPHGSTAFYFSLGVQRPPQILSSFVPSLPSAAHPVGGSSPADTGPN